MSHRSAIAGLGMCLLLSTFSAAGATPAPDILARARQPSFKPCWALMKGVVRHRAGHKTTRFPVEFRARFNGEQALGQLVFNGGERYLVGQTYADGMNGTSVIPQHAASDGAVALLDIGIRPSDLTLSFLYWDFVAEEAAESVKGQKCRVVRLRYAAHGESVRVWLSREYAFPMRVYWYRADAAEPYRRLEFTGFKRVNDFWIVKEFRLRNPEWKTNVEFSDIRVGAVSETEAAPPDLFIVD